MAGRCIRVGVVGCLIAGVLLGAAGAVPTAGATPPPPASIALNGTLRDFEHTSNLNSSGPINPDFEGTAIVDDHGIPTSTLGVDGAPVYGAHASTPTTHSKASFDQWFHNVPGVNVALPYTVTATLVPSSNPPLYTYSNNAFFIADGKGWNDPSFAHAQTDCGTTHNFSFTYAVHSTFTYATGQNFSFSGDDDVFVYINNKLVVDLGGVHNAESGSVNLDTLGLTAGQNYPFDLFYAERHTCASTFALTTSIQLAPANQPPTAKIITPADGATYFQGQPVAASYSCSDPDGTIASCVGPVPNGNPVDTSTLGTHTFKVVATDNLGATGSAMSTYHVVPVTSLCKATALGLPLNINFAVANAPTTPCLTQDTTVVNANSILGTPLLLGLLTNTVQATVLTGHTLAGPGSAAANASVANASIGVPTLGLSIGVVGVASSASSQLTSCSAPATLVSSSKVASLTINGQTIPVADNVPQTIPLAVGTLYVNQLVVQGNTVTRRAVFLDLPGTALDVVIGESTAGATC
jgi:fibro-slime domain-containing protein